MGEEQIREELRGIITAYRKEDYPRLIREQASYPYLYHLSAIRENLISWLPVTKEMCVLERNAEYGALTGRLLLMAGRVVSVTADRESAELIRARYPQDANRLDVLTEREWKDALRKTAELIHARNPQDADRPDVLTEQGWKASQRERQTQTQQSEAGRGEEAAGQTDVYDMILAVGNTSEYLGEAGRYRALLKPGGRLYVADANRLGLKYLAGCQEEYRGGYFTGVENYPEDLMPETDAGTCGQHGPASFPPRCHTRKEYIRLLEEAGFTGQRFYYPYPDHKFPSVIYSDEWLPKRGELTENRRNFDRDRLQLFDEGRVWDTLTEEGLFGEFSNSFLIEAEKRED